VGARTRAAEGELEVVEKVGNVIIEKPLRSKSPKAVDNLGDLSSRLKPVSLLQENVVIVLLDVETTGLDAGRHRVLQLAAKVLGSRAPGAAFATYIRPPENTPWAEGAREVTGITWEVLEKEGALPFSEAWALFRRWLAEVRTSPVAETYAQQTEGAAHQERQVVLVAHNAPFDRRFLEAEIERLLPNVGGGGGGGTGGGGGGGRGALARENVAAVVCTWKLLKDRSLWAPRAAATAAAATAVAATGRDAPSQGQWPVYPSSFKLGDIYEHCFGGRRLPAAHNAVGDVLGLERILMMPHLQQSWRQLGSGPQFQDRIVGSLHSLGGSNTTYAKND